MGKSPGKWIKTVLFGKKSSKSNISKGREKLVNKKEAVVASNVSDDGLALDPTLDKIARHEEDLEQENEESENLSPGNQEVETIGSVDQDAPPDPEKIRLEEAATKAQAAFRGYLRRKKESGLESVGPREIIHVYDRKNRNAAESEEETVVGSVTECTRYSEALQRTTVQRVEEHNARRAFRALKGIIRLQALIRGHLVRRQAVATLCCVYVIVRLQALVRGGRVRQSDIGFEIQKKCNLFKPLDGKLGQSVGISTKISKLSANTFICKLLSSSTTIMALHLQYVGGDPNSVLSWLERWSASYFWKPVPQPKKIRDFKSQRKLGNISIGEAQISKSKRTNRKLPIANFESQSELEKVKRNLRKIHNPVVENAILSEVECETPKQHLEKATVIAGDAVSEQVVNTTNEKIKKEATLTISNVPDVEITPRSLDNKEVSDIPSNDQVTIESKPLTETTTKDKYTSGDKVKNEPINLPETIFKDENSPLTNGDFAQKEDLTGNENQKSTWKASILAKQEHAENGLQNSPTLPSYMAATESAKAKLRTQGSPRFGQDGSERTNSSGRHSLPSSTNSKISSHSPRTHRSVQAGGKGGHKSDRTAPSSRGGNGKVIQAEWRR